MTRNHAECKGVVRLLLLASLAAFALAQGPDAVTLQGGSVLRGYLSPFGCESGDQHVAIQPVGLEVQNVPLSRIVSIQIGAVLLTNATAEPAVGLQRLQDYLHSDPASRAAPQTPGQSFALAPTVGQLCDRPAKAVGSAAGQSNAVIPNRVNGLRVDVNGTLSSGATIQRLIGSNVTFASSPTSFKPGVIILTFYHVFAYGDSIKSSVLTRSSEVNDGGAVVEIRLHNDPNGLNTSFTLNGDLYHSFSQGLQLVQDYGGGIRQSLSSHFFVEGDMWYDHEMLYRPNRTFASPAARILESFGSATPSGRFEFNETLETVLPFDSAEALFMRGTTTLNIALTNPTPSTSSPASHPSAAPTATAAQKQLSLQVSYADDYFRYAAKGFKQNYGKLALGITYNWSK